MQDHAIVLGGSMAGLAAASTLAEQFERVTILDRDRFPITDDHRRGVPQSRHAHGLLAAGRAALEELLPGLTAELTAAGAIPGDLQADCRWYNDGHLLRQADSGLLALAVSRPLLEGRVRARVAALPNVTIIEGCDVTGLVAARGGVGGVRMLRRADGSAEEELVADLVVDTTGRGSRGPAWLEELGYARPAEEQVRVGIAYATRIYRRRPEHLDGDLVAVITAKPGLGRGAAMLGMEGDRWIVTLIGYLGDVPPVDPEGFERFAETLADPAIAETIRDAEPIGDPVATRFPASIRRRYEKLDRFPDGYLVMGDAVCSFNPVFGQGMTVAASEALVLRDCLLAGPDRLAQRFLPKMAALVDIPWEIAVGSDLRFPEVEGPRTAKVRMINAYLARLYVVAESDPVVGEAFVRVLNLIDRPERLMRPAIAARVLRGARRSAKPERVLTPA
jgi:2-polyprenyl-6-methoxyphenol hydroxylase-like FAD-dependent oxidoreductase